ncbi:hypothetical protein PENTCL1PPCAC_26923, partial [Pristionchus entomophagus]
ETLSQFMADQNRKRWITSNVNTSVWDAARLLVLNRVHRLPILQCELGDVLAGSRSDDVLYILTLKNIFIETVLKLNDPKLELGPHVKQRSLSEAKVGTWTNIFTLTHHFHLWRRHQYVLREEHLMHSHHRRWKTSDWSPLQGRYHG